MGTRSAWGCHIQFHRLFTAYSDMAMMERKNTLHMLTKHSNAEPLRNLLFLISTEVKREGGTACLHGA